MFFLPPPPTHTNIQQISHKLFFLFTKLEFEKENINYIDFSHYTKYHTKIITCNNKKSENFFIHPFLKHTIF